MNEELKRLMYSYMPEQTNLLAKIYKGVSDQYPLVLQTHLWDYKESYIRDVRAGEILQVASEVLDEPR